VELKKKKHELVMPISLGEIEYWELALYSLGFAGIALISLGFLLMFVLISGKIRRGVLKFFNKRLKKRPDRTHHISYVRNDHNKKVRLVTTMFNWIEKIIGLSILLFIILTMVKLLIKDDTYAYTILTLVIFVISNQATSFIRNSMNTDKHVFNPYVKLGEKLELEGELGIVARRGHQSFWLKGFKPVIVNGKQYIKMTRFPLSILDHAKHSKFIRLNNNEIGETDENERKPNRDRIVIIEEKEF